MYLSSEDIKEVMNFNSVTGSSGLSSAAARVPLPAPKLLNVDSPALNPMESIAALQARINSRMEKMVGPIGKSIY